ncbi:hypothetical protein Tco_1389585 [Tanacetum coccineum]
MMFESLLEIEKLEEVSGVELLLVDFLLAMNVFMLLVGSISLRELRDVNLDIFMKLRLTDGMEWEFLVEVPWERLQESKLWDLGSCLERRECFKLEMGWVLLEETWELIEG